MNTMCTIQQVSAAEATALLDDLVRLLQNVVDDGASIGFLPPLAQAEAESYWRKVIADLAAENGRVLLVARQDDAIVGSAQLMLESRRNGDHRGEVQKVMVHTQFRRRGIARQLMLALEAAAHAAKRTLLVLDTRQGDLTEHLYQSLGYIKAGVIPHYARNADGGLDATVLYYRVLS